MNATDPSASSSSSSSTAGVVFHLVLGVLVLLLSAFYLEFNRQAASRDAIAYAAKVRQQQREARAEIENSNEEENTRPNNVIDKRMVEKEQDDNHDDDDVQNGNESSAKKDYDDNDSPNGGGGENTGKRNKFSFMKEEEEDVVMLDGICIPAAATNQGEREDLFVINSNNWRCSCGQGFLPAGMVKSLGGAEAVFRMSAGGCYHKQT